MPPADLAPGRALSPARLVLSFCYFFSLLAAYYVLRPVREEMAVQFGPERAQWLFTGTFICMTLLVPVYGAIVSKFRRRVFVPAIYAVFIGCLLTLHSLFSQAQRPDWLAPAFVIWLSVFNLYAVSVFWSFMADVWDPADAKRWFGVIAGGGTVGGIVGPALTSLLVSKIALSGLMLVAAGLLLLALLCSLSLSGSAKRRENGRPLDDAPPIGGTILAGIRLIRDRSELRPLVLMMFLGVLMGSMIYIQQLGAVKAAIADSHQRTAFFANIDLSVNFLTLLAQLFVTRLILTRISMDKVLMIPPLLACVSLAVLAMAPTVWVLTAIQILTRAGRFAITEPAFANLYTSVDREARYKTKSFIDTAVYRFGDLSSAWMVAGLTNLGMALGGFAALGSAISLLLTRVGFVAGRDHERRLRTMREPADSAPG
ncbi:MAG: MFS transporter [Xanthomonadales bacterium]|nr:MFS transporter [Xanthomonadales bacterium]